MACTSLVPRSDTAAQYPGVKHQSLPEIHMKNDPYLSPELNSSSINKRSIWWKIYFFLINLLAGIGMLSLMSHPNVGIAEYIFLPLWVVATAGLFGFVFIKPIYKPTFWLKLLITYIGFSLIYYFITKIDQSMSMGDIGFYISTAVSWIISLPAYYALYAYSRPNNPAWENA